MIIRLVLWLMSMTISPQLFAQLLNSTQIEQAAKNYFNQALTEYKEFLRIPNNGNYEDHIEQNLQWCVDAFSERGFRTSVIRSKGLPHD